MKCEQCKHDFDRKVICALCNHEFDPAEPPESAFQKAVGVFMRDHHGISVDWTDMLIKNPITLENLRTFRKAVLEEAVRAIDPYSEACCQIDALKDEE